ncbi:acyl-CoA/acyl-ACP dehydrogenase [Streptomyces sp. RG38]|uniref:Acyl-CoA/acyl-ACP dehydrogenase n=1 Tax=Streptomyces tagetis TaxID=2820809 RepID=A0A940XFL3_9ACTN|nr:acyl-CoA/acyl-ACP dehydrogenase [Streptomyces sp. RG38]
MRYLERERELLDHYLPGLDAALAARPLAALERPGGEALTAFRAAGGPGLLVPAEHGGKGADLLSAVRVQRAVGSRSPSLAVATTMHHFSVASLVETAAVNDGPEWLLLSAIAQDRLLLASGFAEGRTGQGILSPSLTARVDGDKVWLSGSKKPCSLARSMDLLTASVVLPDPDGSPRMAVALVPADSPGVSVRPFWDSPVLAGAESEEVVLEDVEVPSDLVVRTDVTADGRLDRLQTAGFVWFETLMTASYLGAASALVERLLSAPKAGTAARAEAATVLHGAVLALDGLARTAGTPDENVLADALVCRYAAQRAIDQVADLCVEALGGMAFISSGDVAYLNSACRALAFHPPSRNRMAGALADHFTGHPLHIS